MAADNCCVSQCAISVLADYYVEGPYTVPPVARAALASSYVSSGNLTLADYISRSQARILVSPSFHVHNADCLLSVGKGQKPSYNSFVLYILLCTLDCCSQEGT